MEKSPPSPHVTLVEEQKRVGYKIKMKDREGGSDKNIKDIARDNCEGRSVC